MADLPDPLLAQLGEFVAARIGLHFPRERWRDLERGIRSAAGEFGFGNVEACIEWLMASPLAPSQIEILASHLTIGETYFFRDKGLFGILENEVLPELIRAHRGSERRLRLWSAGCCTGEEPYSVAILLSKLIPDLPDWQITILATDINPRFLRKAAGGVYGEWSFRDAPPGFKERYFRKAPDGRFETLPYFKNLVTFSYLNLAEDAYPSLLNNTNAMDLILCRNVLMYFAPERARQVAQNLHRALVDGGQLIVSPSETSQTLFSQFAAVNYPGAILYRKGDPLPPGTPDAAPTVTPISRGAQTTEFPILLRPTRPEPARNVRRTPLPLAPPEPEDALALYRRGRYDEAAEKALASLARNPNNIPVLELAARIYANQGKLTEALVWCDRAIAADKLNPAGHYLRATILQEHDRPEEATLSLRRALYLDPDFVLAHFALGNLTRRQGRIREAEKHWQNALTLLRACRPEDTLPESDGMTAGRLAEIVQAATIQEALA